MPFLQLQGILARTGCIVVHLPRSMRYANLLVVLAALTVGCSNNIDAIYSKGLDAYTKRDYYAAERDIRKAAQAGHIDEMAMLG